MTRCTSCGAAIMWCTTLNGKAMPVDLAPVEDGNLVVARMVARPATIFDPPGDRYVSHFATCPTASEHRKR